MEPHQRLCYVTFFLTEEKEAEGGNKVVGSLIIAKFNGSLKLVVNIWLAQQQR